MAKRADRARGRARAATRSRATGTRGRLTVDQAVIAVLIAAMDADRHVSREEAWRAHHIIWSMRRFRRRSGEVVDRLIDGVRARMEKEGSSAVLRQAARTLPAGLRPPAFAVAVDLLLADGRLGRAERAFVTRLAAELKVRPALADELVRALLVKNSA